MLQKFGIGLVVCVALVVVLWNVIGGTAGLVAAALPDFPDYPDAQTQLAAEAEGAIYFASSTPYDFDVILAGVEYAIPTVGFGTLTLPEGASADAPVPAIVVVHGSGGINPGREAAYAKIYNDNGYAAFVLDYYAPRGIAPDDDYMRKIISVTEFDALADAYGALEILSTHPSIDASRIALAGFSYGGMATRFAMDERVREAFAPEHRGFAAFVDVYGPCFQVLGTRRTNGAPLLTLRGTEDASNDIEACALREDELRAVGVDVEAHVYEGAGHAWENEKPREMFEDAPYVAGCEVRYDANGHSSVDGVGIVNVPPDTPRPERVVIRMGSGTAMAKCVSSGYVVGGDPPVRAKADAAMLAFLARNLRP